MEPRNSRCFFEHLAALSGFGGNDRADPPLTDQRRRMCARCRVGKNQLGIACTRIASVDTICRSCPTLDPADNFHLVISALGKDRNFGKLPLRTARGASENNIVHRGQAQRFGRPLAHHPPDRFEQVRFTASVRPDHAG